ncbi:MAG: hypothetical protein Q8M76_11775, partial [Spirochaetaceae bacterium]|nr:hypothetical protein [Spirochaetaceae bacterium]
PGEREVYRFAVVRDGTIGVGLRAESDGLAARIYDSAMRVLAEGPVLARRMESGEYYLIVESGERTIRYAPVFVGLEGSRTEAPEEIIASYLNDGE